ncbi:peptide-methionine (S)-S-oxide reductase MsrA [Alphaproteobacteria bacterium]|nr:peptide-methionine (S)-S-oxide reductase MsrA [Alphaproteobacteria bacterium]
MLKAIFAAGCFWGVEKKFSELKGVIETEVGYAQGDTLNPNYEEVCGGKTNHAEVVLIKFDETIVNYETLVRIFYSLHDPTTLNQQGPDRGTQYRSIIIYDNEEQKKTANAVTKELNQLKFNNAITTTIEALGTYQKAEDYHQQYLIKKYSFVNV